MPRNRATERASSLVAALLVLAALTLAPVALADKGGGGNHGSGGGGNTTSGGTISLVMVSDANGDGLPNFGDRVTFAVSTTATTQPWVTAYCYQGGSLVYQQSNGIFPGSLNEIFTLGPTPAWQGGAADCTAYLQDWDSYAKHGRITNLAPMDFHVSS
jgi:hypothetical protein